MQPLFYAVALCGSLYFLFRKRRFDFFTVGFFGSLIYFLPGFFGYVRSIPYVIAGLPYQVMQIPISTEAYAVMALVPAAVLVGAILDDTTSVRLKPIPRIRGGDYLPHFALVLTIVLGTITLVRLGEDIFRPKLEWFSKVGPTFSMWNHAASLTFLCGIASGRRWLGRLGVFLLVFLVIVGSRGPLAMSFITAITLLFHRSGQIRLFTAKIRYLFGVIAVGLFLFVAKGIYATVRTGTVFAFLMDPQNYIQQILVSEPFTTQLILNEVIESHFHIGMSHLSGLIAQFLVIPSYFGVRTSAFNDLFQPTLFPEAEMNMAYNIWAEAIAAGGWLFLFVIVFLYVVGLKVGGWFLRTSDEMWRPIVSLMGSYWAFYIHRNSIASELTYMRLILVVAIVCFVGSRLFIAMRDFLGVVARHPSERLPS